jgi:hypothetical protein
MAFAVPEGLAPELYPLAWLVGTWRGPGFLAYPEISERPFVQEVTFGHDGGPYLSYGSAIWLLDEDADGDADVDRTGATEVRYTVGPVWAVESGYWRPAAGGQRRVAPADDAATDDAATDIEVLLAEPTGHVSIYLGTVHGPRVEIATDLVARTSTAVEISAVHRMYGLVGGELMWALDMAAFGHELRPYASARLSRVTAASDDPAPARVLS